MCYERRCAMVGRYGSDGDRAIPGPMSGAVQPSEQKATPSRLRSTSRLSRHAYQIEKVFPSLDRPYNRVEVTSQVTSLWSRQRETLTSAVLVSAQRPKPRTRLRLSHVDRGGPYPIVRCTAQ